jgi:hypothetical protein
METSQVLLTVGQVAGIGGVSLLIFRDVIRKNIFPTLGQAQAYRLIRLIVSLTFAIAACGIAAWVYVQRPQGDGGTITQFPPHNPEPVMRAHLQLIDDEKYIEAYAKLSNEARRRFQQDFFLSAFENQRRPQGRPLSRTLYGVSTARELPDKTQGAFATGTFLTYFDRGGSFMETVTLTAEQNAWKVLFHMIAPCQPPACMPTQSSKGPDGN